MERLTEDGEKYQSEVQNLVEMNKEFQAQAEKLEKNVQEAHERYVNSKGKGKLSSSRKAKRSTSQYHESENVYASG